MSTRCMRKAGLMLVALTVGVMTGFAVEKAYWQDGGTGPFDDPSHWKNGIVPSAGWQVRFESTKDAVVGDDDMELFMSFDQVVLPGVKARLTIRNEKDFTIQKGNAWFVSDGVVIKTGSGKLTLDHSSSATMISLSGGFEVRGGELALASSASVQITPQCPIGVFSPGALTLPDNQVCKFKGLYGDGHINNPAYESGKQLFIISGTRENPSEFSGTFENKVLYQGENGYQRFSNSEVEFGGNMYKGYLGTALFPSVILRNNCEYEYLGTGETVASSRTVFMNNNTCCLTLNGGTNGALNVAAKLYYNADSVASTYVGEIVWTGDHVNPCEFTGEMSVNGARPVYWKKTGTGTWRFTGTASRGNRGVVATEKGRLEYDNMAEAGSASPLGTANNLLSEYYGSAVDDSKRVSYAYLLGDGTNTVDATTATMAYIGTAAKTIKTRPVALKGAGRFEATTAALDWTGFTSAEEDGTNTLVLAGSAAGCVARDVTNGVGRIAVVKEGTGDWTIRGSYDFSAGVEARGGQLTLSGSDYQWYRLSLMQNYAEYDPGDTGTPLGKRPDHDGNRIWLTGFGLYDSEGVNQIPNLTVNSAANGNATLLNPGEAALGHADFSQMGSGTTYQLANLFADDNTPFGGNRTINPAVPDNQNSWVRVVVRLPAGSHKPVAYDIKSYGNKGWTAGLVRDVRSWKLEGSLDGENWTELHSVYSNEAHVVTANYSWYSSNTTTFEKGYEVSGTSPDLRPTSMETISVSGDATLVTETPITANGIRYDVALGGGTIDGFNLAAVGTLEILNQPKGASWNLPITFVHCTGSLDGWTVKVNGEIKKGYSAAITDEGITVYPTGLLLFFK